MKKSHCKRCLALLLCTALLAGMMGALTVPASAASGYCAGDHVFQVTGSVSSAHDCEYGDVNYQIHRCTRCGLEYYTAIRSNGGNGGGRHNWVAQELPGGCGSHPGILSTCSVCGMKKFNGGGSHSWSAWTSSDGRHSCTDSYTETRTCTACGAAETRTVSAGGHDFRIIVSETSASCEDPGVTVKECSRCGERRTFTTPALGHSYPAGVDCTARHTCARCGKTINGYAHSWGEYIVTAEGHYQRCRQCPAASVLTKHTDSGNGYCVCGQKVASAKCSHNWTIEKRTSAFTHQERCTLCGAVRSVNCTESTLYTPRTDCTTTEYCACGNVRREPQKNHNIGTWRCTDSTHTHPCLNSGCQYGHTPEPHTFQTVSGGLKKCSVCNYIDPKSLASHTHSYAAAWSQDDAHHWRACSCGDKQGYAEHTFTEGVCTVCGYQEPNHADAEHQRPSPQNPDTQNPETQKPETQNPSVNEDFQAEAMKQFKDVKEKDYFSGAVGWAVKHSITNGTSTKNKTFSPNETCSQIQILTMLYRAQRGSGAADKADMDAAVAWATRKGIIGSGFDPYAPCTRATAVYYIWKAADSPKAENAGFSDVSGSASYAQAVAWAVANGVTNGTDTRKNTFSPDDICNRGEIVTFLYREAVEPLQK